MSSNANQKPTLTDLRCVGVKRIYRLTLFGRSESGDETLCGDCKTTQTIVVTYRLDCVHTFGYFSGRTVCYKASCVSCSQYPTLYNLLLINNLVQSESKPHKLYQRRHSQIVFFGTQVWNKLPNVLRDTRKLLQTWQFTSCRLSFCKYKNALDHIFVTVFIPFILLPCYGMVIAVCICLCSVIIDKLC